MTTLRQKTTSGLAWSFIEDFSKVGIEFIIGIILARILLPEEFGLIGMITVFIAISNTFIDSGFSNSLIRKKDCTQNDFSTVFYFNVVISVLFYSILFFLAIPISKFYNEPKLVEIIRVLGIVLIINSFCVVQRAIRTKRVDFKLQTKISIITSVIAGGISVYMAYTGWGVWSLVWKAIIAASITSILFWLWNNWHPALLFDNKTFKEHFKFGYKLLLSGLINTLYTNIYYLIIGKYFSAAELGYYTRSQQFSNLPASNITGVISRVSYPVLAQLQGDSQKLKDGYKKLIKSTMYISFVLMIGMAAIAKPLILTLIGSKWAPSIFILQLLCFSAMLYPLHALNLNILNVKGRSDLFLRLEIIKKIMAIPIIIIAILMGIKAMLIGVIIISFLGYFINAFYSQNLINYPIKEQISDILPSFILSFSIGIVILLIGYLLPFIPLTILIIQVLSGFIFVIILSEMFKIDGYIEIRRIVLNKLSLQKNK